MRVLAAGQTIEQKDNKPVTVNTVTLALTPEDTEKLALASNDGIIQLVMRNFADNVLVPTGGVQQRTPPFVVPERASRARAAPAKGEKPRRVQEEDVARRRFGARAEKGIHGGSHQGEQADGRESRLNGKERISQRG